ncbi:hypothetical protein HHUSO_G26678 [Huso huso]|uniref:Uncharacterized protein n=1 Tax=Huso huso TaxID=61971 RepID=A0ABR0YKZ2_HUSHU
MFQLLQPFEPSALIELTGLGLFSARSAGLSLDNLPDTPLPCARGQVSSPWYTANGTNNPYTDRNTNITCLSLDSVTC